MFRIAALILAAVVLLFTVQPAFAKPHACTQYIQLVCKICGPKTKTCADTTARWHACMQSRSCDKSICADSLKSAAALDEGVVRSMLCGLEQHNEPKPEPES